MTRAIFPPKTPPRTTMASNAQKALTLSAKHETRSAPLGLRVPPSIKEALERAAKDDNRSMASMADIILTQWLREKGYLTNENAAPKDGSE